MRVFAHGSHVARRTALLVWFWRKLSRDDTRDELIGAGYCCRRDGLLDSDRVPHASAQLVQICGFYIQAFSPPGGGVNCELEREYIVRAGVGRSFVVYDCQVTELAVFVVKYDVGATLYDTVREMEFERALRFPNS